MVKLSMRLRHALLARRLEGVRQHQIARAAGLHPTIVSNLLHDALPLREGDERVIRLADVLGVPADAAFEDR